MNSINLVIQIIAILCNFCRVSLGRVSLIDQLNYFVSESQNAPQEFGQLQTSISMKNIMANSMNIAINACQNSFKWDRWNCPSSDFILRSSSKSLLLDHEDSYVKAIFTASVLYAITKNCSGGVIAGCNTCPGNSHNSHCPDNPKAAAKLLRPHFEPDFQNNLNGKVAHHNYIAITNLLEKSLKKQCICRLLGPTGVCSKEICFQVLKSFEDIAADVRQMYEEGLQLDNNSENSRIMWHNIPLDVLLYIKDSPNYCEPYATPHWKGMRGRQCTTNTVGKNLTQEQRKRCRHLCRECGYAVAKKNVVADKRCNCKFTRTFQVQCELCVTVQKQYYCY